MQWQMHVPTGYSIEAAAANLLDALERARPITEKDAGRGALGRWLFQAGDSGTIAEDTVLWLHRVLVSDQPAL
jgi:hypothetical protein